MSDLWMHPSVILIIGALLVPFMQNPVVRRPFLMAVPILTFLQVVVVNSSPGTFGVVNWMDWYLTFGRVDQLSIIFSFIMSLMCCVGTLYGLHNKNPYEHMAAWIYVAGSLGAIYCGDYIVLFLFWELMAFSSVFLIWFRKREQSKSIGYRYLLVHTAGGLFLLAGFVLRYQATGGDYSFGQLDVDHPTLYIYLIGIGLILNAAVPPFHSWLPDAYAEATVTGSVFMCAFTTKTAIYAMARSLAGFDILIPMGVCMALYGVVYAVLENDCRRLLAWHIISQVGYMVTGVGIGTALAINGTCAHAFAHILYKGLLFMGTGSVLYMTGKSKFTELGGLYKKMPLTFVFTMIGGLSISGWPLFSGFVSKSMIIAAAANSHVMWASFLLILASAGTFLHTGLKVPYFIWFGKNNCSDETWEKAADPPLNMLLAMGVAAFLCFTIGSYLPFLYDMLPYQSAEFHPYNAYHLAETLQILCFTALGFFLLLSKLTPEAKISIDLDWIYRMGGRLFLWFDRKVLQTIDNGVGMIWTYCGIYPLMTISNFWSWFDWNGIDGVVDGVARSVRGLGGQVRKIQSGQIQNNIYFAATAMAIAIIAYVFA